MHKPAVLALLSLSLALAACGALGPNYSAPPMPVPEAFSTGGGSAQSQGAWWTTFGDAELVALIEQALRDSPDIELAAARLRQARASQGIQETVGGPTLNASGKIAADRLSENSENFANLPSTTSPKTDFTNHQIGFDASWEIDLFGRRQRLAEAAAARSEAAAERVRDVRTVIAAEVVRNYVELRLAQQRLALAAGNLRNYEDILRLTALTAKVGEATRLDVQRAEAAADNYRASLPPLHLAERQSIAALSALTAVPVPELLARLAAPAAPAELVPVPEAPAAGLPSELLRRRPDLRAAERDLAAASADIGVAVAEQYPRFSLIGTAGWTSIRAGSLLDAASRMWSIGPQISLPLFNGGRLQNQVRANEAAFDGVRASYRKAVLTAVADAEVALSRLGQNEERRQRLLSAQARQARLLALTERQVEAGEVTRTTLLEARKTLVSQEDQTLQAHAQSLTALISLYKTLGGNWEQ
jgi:NodT family efflux transporter outer membrane factor (OMF) lipoprotein